MGFRGRGFKSRRPDWLKDKKPQALHRIRCEACSFSPGNPLYVHQAVRRRSATTRRPACAPVHAAARPARALLASPPATRLAERAPVGYITPTYLSPSEVQDGC